MKIAVCDDISQFHGDRLRDREWARRFPGSEWVTALYEREATEPLEVASGDVALERVRRGAWAARDVHVVQELDARYGRELCALGARPALLTMLESPLVAYRWNDRLLRRCASFEHCIGPSWALERIPALRRSHHHRLRFPCYWRGVLGQRHDSQRAHRVALVAANKYWRERPFARAKSLRDALRACRHLLRRSISSTYAHTRGWQLHDERLGLICALASHDMVDVWGKGWDRLSNLPPRWRAQLGRYRSAFRGPCDEKLSLLRQYEFAIAYENTRVPGYVTEKVIDAMVSGCVPVYRGAPDITEHVPSGAILEVGNRTPPERVADTIRSMRDDDVRSVVAAGAEFLSSPAGDRHSFEGFAEHVIALLRGTPT